MRLEIMEANPKKSLFKKEFENVREEIFSLWSICDEGGSTSRGMMPQSRIDNVSSNHTSRSIRMTPCSSQQNLKLQGNAKVMGCKSEAPGCCL